VSNWVERLLQFRPYFEILHAISSVLSILTWVVAVPFLIITWRRAKAVKFRIFGIEATFQQGMETAAAIGAAAGKYSTLAGEQQTQLRPSALARTVESAIAAPEGRRIAGRSILWVDDNPPNNEYERRALTALGITVTNALDTEPALKQLGAAKYDLIISDMGRPSGKRAGYALLQALREREDKTPFLIYSSSNAPEHKQEAAQRGAQGATNDPLELLELVVELLTGGRE